MSKSMFTSVVLFIITLGLAQLADAQNSGDPPAGSHPKYHKQIEQIGKEFKKKGFDLDSLFSDHRFKIYGSIGHKFTHSAERVTPTLSDYKKLLGFKKKIILGAQFVKNHRKALKKAQKKYGISRFVIAAVLGIESDFGRNIGHYNPFNVYVSMLVVNYRSKFAREQLDNLLNFTHRKNLDVLALKSSYAGAMSYAQFTPYSVNKWWVGDKIFDMTNSIMSVANYLHYYKKRTGSLSKAVMRYNPSSLYRDFVLDLGKAIKKKHKAGQNKK
jgi:membrane-bound lytic murein transglycosylase B